uniref:Dynein, cytoplasmic 1, intermediate chain 2a n=1 Tax=Neogobius melanostomus TaxID=47308 RepID=A0A8C6UID3_9GOBI
HTKVSSETMWNTETTNAISRKKIQLNRERRGLLLVYTSVAPKLGMAKVTHVDFPPREMVSYTKETQTPVLTQPKEGETHITVFCTSTKAPPELQFTPPHELTEEEKLQILHTEEFVNFFDHSSRIIERALSERVDLFFDYSGRDLEEKEGEIQAGAKLSLNRLFMDEHWSKHRVVTCLDWSLQYPELLVASYNNNEEAPHEPDGVALVWNLKYKKATPEYVFHCQSAVMSAAFAKFHPNVVVGGTYSGQIVLWDNRSNKRTPVQRTPLSAAAHTHPVYCVNVVGTQNAHNLISISTDGKMCSWSLDMLSQPQDSIELVFKQSKAVAVTSMSFPLGDVNNFVVGSEDGSVYMSCRHGSKAGISEMFEGHHGPITGINCHTAGGPLDFSHLFVTSSFDWTVKLWSTKNNKPLYSFEDNSDYVYDVMWSPIHPALFACVDGVGHLDLWNLNNDTEVPTASVTVDGNPALNRVRWSHSGKEIAVGDSDGRVRVYDVGEQTAVPRSDEWTRFVRTLAEINENRDDAEEQAAQRLAA